MRTNDIKFIIKFFEPYNVFHYTFNATKPSSNKTQTNSVIIIVVETDIPLLNVSVPSNLITQKINKNDALSVTIYYNADPDQVLFSLIFIYKLDVVATKSYSYTTFSFRIWDLYNAFTPNSPTLLLRVSLYDPHYFMPSQSSYQVTINFEPVPGTISITPSTGTALSTAFTISVSGCYDEDSPLSYMFVYYTSVDDY